jgi:hypothetical protein
MLLRWELLPIEKRRYLLLLRSRPSFYRPSSGKVLLRPEGRENNRLVKEPASG